MKIKNFNLSNFKRMFLGDKKQRFFISEQLLRQSFKSGSSLPTEDRLIYDILLSSLKTTGSLPFELTSPEINFLQTNDISVWCDYLIYRYKFKVYPKIKKVSNFPVYLLIEPVSACNLRCKMCFQIDKTFTKKPYMGVMALDFFKKIIDEAAAGGTKAITLASRGEPTMNKNFSDMIKYTNGKFYEVKVNTNGTRLTEDHCHAILSSGVTEMCFSIDAENKELYEKIRVRGNFDVVIKNIKMFEEIRRRDYPNSNIITTASGVFFHEEQNIDSFVNFFNKLVDNTVAVKIENRWNTYANEVHPEMVSSCDYLWERMYVWFDGICNPCDVDYKSFLKVGNLKQNTIKEIWHSAQYENLRKEHLQKKRSKFNPCDRCGIG